MSAANLSWAEDREEEAFGDDDPAGAFPLGGTGSERGGQTEADENEVRTMTEETTKRTQPRRPRAMSDGGGGVPSRRLRVWQQNACKSLLVQHDLLELLRRDFEVCAIQEPYIDFCGASRTNPHWQAIYPSNHHGDINIDAKYKKMRSIILVSAAIASNAWSEIPFDSLDITGVQLTGDFGTIRIINIYNNCEDNSSLDTLAQYL